MIQWNQESKNRDMNEMNNVYELLKTGHEDKNDFLSNLYEIAEIFEQADGVNDLFYEFARPHLEFLSRHLTCRLCLNRQKKM